MRRELKIRDIGTVNRFSKGFLREAGIAPEDTQTAEMINSQIVLTPSFRHRSLKERAAAFGGDLKLSDEMERDEPVGTEVW